MKKIKADISLGATQKEREDVVKRMQKIQKLMRHFGVEAFAFDPGVRCFVLGDGMKRVDFDGDTWAFIEPLFKELIYLRAYYQTSVKRKMKNRRKYAVAGKKS